MIGEGIDFRVKDSKGKNAMDYAQGKTGDKQSRGKTSPKLEKIISDALARLKTLKFGVSDLQKVFEKHAIVETGKNDDAPFYFLFST